MNEKDKLNAKKAREITKASDSSLVVDSILKEVEREAKKGNYKCIIQNHGFGDGILYAPENQYPEHIKAVLRQLRNLGYKADVMVEEKQFVNIWLEITWDE